MASRNLLDLKESVRGRACRLLALCDPEGLDLLIYCTYRSPEEQADLFARGRTPEQIRRKIEELVLRWGRPDLADLLQRTGARLGPRVTHAGPGQSLHNYGLAFDAVPLRGGKAVWGTRHPQDRALWDRYGLLGESVGLEWAGRWTRFREFPHMQEPGADWRRLILPEGEV